MVIPFTNKVAVHVSTPKELTIIVKILVKHELISNPDSFIAGCSHRLPNLGIRISACKNTGYLPPNKTVVGYDSLSYWKKHNFIIIEAQNFIENYKMEYGDV